MQPAPASRVILSVQVEQVSSYPSHSGVMVLPWLSLFPGSLVPLHIFEERYRQMVQSALSSHRMFAIAHAEEGEFCEPFGGLGIIRACVANGDGTSNLILQGVARVEFGEFEMEPFPRAQISIVPDGGENGEAVRAIRSRVAKACRAALEMGMEAPKGFAEYIETVRPEGAFADIVASAMVADPVQRRTLLLERNVAARLELLHELIRQRMEAA